MKGFQHLVCPPFAMLITSLDTYAEPRLAQYISLCWTTIRTQITSRHWPPIQTSRHTKDNCCVSNNINLTDQIPQSPSPDLISSQPLFNIIFLIASCCMRRPISTRSLRPPHSHPPRRSDSPPSPHHHHSPTPPHSHSHSRSHSHSPPPPAHPPPQESISAPNPGTLSRDDYKRRNPLRPPNRHSG